MNFLVYAWYRKELGKYSVVVIAGVIGLMLVVGMAAGLGSSGSSGSSSIHGSSTSYVSHDSSSPSLTVSSGNDKSNRLNSNLAKSNPNSKDVLPKYLHDNVSTALRTLMSHWQNEANPGIPICRFNNGIGQCQSAATLQCLMNINAGPTDGLIYDLIKGMRNKSTEPTVNIQSFLNEFKRNYLTDNYISDNNFQEQLDTFLTGKLKCKQSDGRGRLVATGKARVGSASDYLNSIINLFKLEYCDDYSLSIEDNVQGNSKNVMVNYTPPSLETINPPDDIYSLAERMTSSVYSDMTGFGCDCSSIKNAPKHLCFSTENMLPACMLNMLYKSREASEDARNGRGNRAFKHELEFDLEDGNKLKHHYRLKSMVCRSTPEKLLTAVNRKLINKQAGTHFVSVINTDNKFIKIDSSSPNTVESCPNDHIINFVKTGNGSYLLPVIMMFEKVE